MVLFYHTSSETSYLVYILEGLSTSSVKSDMTIPYSYFFGVEIELLASPHKIHYPWSQRYYYKKLAKSIRSFGAEALADTSSGRYSKHPEHYDKWWITKDGSLGDPVHPLGRRLWLRIQGFSSWAIFY